MQSFPSQVDMLVQQLRSTPRQLIPTYTLATLPNAALYPSAEILVSDYGGIRCRSNGVRWRPISAFLTLGHTNTRAAIGATTTEAVLSQVALPVPLFGPNDHLFCEVQASVSPNTNNKNFILRLGGDGTNGANLCSRGEAGATTNSSGFKFGFCNRESMSFQEGKGSGATAGASTVNATSSIDTNVAQNVYLTGRKVTNASDFLASESVIWYMARGID